MIRCYESMMTAFAAWSCGAHLCLQALGVLDSINAMSYGKFCMDLEVWEYLRRLARYESVDEATLASDTIASTPSHYLDSPHTIRHFREALDTPALARAVTYEAWVEDGRSDASQEAERRAQGKPVLCGLHP